MARHNYELTSEDERCILNYLQRCSTRHSERTMKMATVYTKLKSRLGAGVRALSHGQIEYRVNKLVTRLSNHQLHAKDLLQRGIFELKDGALLECYEQHQIDAMRRKENERGNMSAPDSDEEPGEDNDVKSERPGADVDLTDDEATSDYNPGPRENSAGTVSKSMRSTRATAAPGSPKPSGTSIMDPCGEGRESSSMLGKRKRDADNDADDAGVEEPVSKRLQITNSSYKAGSVRGSAVDAIDLTNEAQLHSSPTGKVDQAGEPQRTPKRGADNAEVPESGNADRYTTPEAAAAQSPNANQTGLANVVDDQPSPRQSGFQVEELQLNEPLPMAKDPSTVANVMKDLQSRIDEAVHELLAGLNINANQPFHIDSSFQLPEILCQLLHTITGRKGYINTPQIRTFFATEAQLNYNIKWVLESLIGAALHRFCLKSLKQGEDFILDLDHGKGNIQEVLKRTLKPTDYLKMELEFFREHIKKDIKPDIATEASKLASDLDSILPYIIPRPPQNSFRKNILDKMVQFTPPDVIPNQGHLPVAYKDHQRTWLRQLTEIFTIAMEFRAKFSALGNAELKYEFPTYRSGYERSTGEKFRNPRELDGNPDARVILCFMPRVMMKTRMFLERDLPHEGWTLAYNGVVLTGP